MCFVSIEMGFFSIYVGRAVMVRFLGSLVCLGCKVEKRGSRGFR